MSEKADSIKEELANTADDAREAFGSLSPEQLNWKPAADSWSVAQCLDHLIKTNNEMRPIIEAKLRGEPNSFWEKVSPLSGFFGGFLKKSLVNDAKKFKAPTKEIVPPSDVDADIVEQFCRHQQEVIDQVDALGKLDWDRTVITSPFLKLMTYRLGDALDIMIEHEKRHIRQAKRVVAAEGFPGGKVR